MSLKSKVKLSFIQADLTDVAILMLDRNLIEGYSINQISVGDYELVIEYIYQFKAGEVDYSVREGSPYISLDQSYFELKKWEVVDESGEDQKHQFKLDIKKLENYFNN